MFSGASIMLKPYTCGFQFLTVHDQQFTMNRLACGEGRRLIVQKLNFEFVYAHYSDFNSLRTNETSRLAITCTGILFELQFQLYSSSLNTTCSLQTLLKCGQAVCMGSSYVRRKIIAVPAIEIKRRNMMPFGEKCKAKPLHITGSFSDELKGIQRTHFVRYCVRSQV